MSITRALIIIIAQEVLFDGMLLVKGIVLKRRIARPVRGRNREALAGALFYPLYMVTAAALSALRSPIGSVDAIGDAIALAIGVFLLLCSLVVSGAALLSMKESWRVAALDEEGTELIETGIYRLSRNPYALSNIIMFVGCALLIENVLLLALCPLGFALMHRMILSEEVYLSRIHGERYEAYRSRVPRYLFL
jgi:protein-S-isoprenylcysteine O-methyltransferase Ste14